MKRMYLFFSGIIGIILSGCIYTKMKNLTNEDLEWIKVYDIEDSVLFISQTGRIDTMVITEKYMTNRKSHFYFNEADDNIYEANAGYDFFIKNGSDIIDGGFVIQTKIGSDSLYTIYNLGGRFSRNDGLKSIIRPINISKFKCNGKILNDCVIADSITSSYSEYWDLMIKNKIEMFVWSKKYGLVYYRFEDGEEFYRKD